MLMQNNDYLKEFIYWLIHDSVSIKHINSAIEKAIESRIEPNSHIVFNDHIMNYAKEISKILRNDQ